MENGGEEEEPVDLLNTLREILKKSLAAGPSNTTEGAGQDNYSKINLTPDEDITDYQIDTVVPETLEDKKVLVVGVGNLGRTCLTHLATAGIGELTIVDYNDVNLQSAIKLLKSINSGLKVVPINMHLSSVSLSIFYAEHGLNFDVVVEGTNEVESRYFINDFCAIYRLPIVTGWTSGTQGLICVSNYMGRACYRCLYPNPPPSNIITTDVGGTLGAVNGVIGALQALETIKILHEKQNVLSGAMRFRTSNESFAKLTLNKPNVNCAACSDSPTITIAL